jgi:hypothetical protein
VLQACVREANIDANTNVAGAYFISLGNRQACRHARYFTF